MTTEVLGPEVGETRWWSGCRSTTSPTTTRTTCWSPSAGRTSATRVVLRHLVDHPRELVVDQNPQGAALKVTDESGTATLVSLLRPRDGGQGS
ncbi:hypothetical protein E4P40_07875 [Blastococcus sp. CT_GayMR20]|uniref:hypothetical protein n=1 Tax=Blastococcus sp. CT_GayMR20 TaxID=2559609 RepID=UPI00107347B9|nr:hypothetical protein [Blastococcus sp. CT_GayMR20]TFV90125.1 hypothetical protein E4P40_07875 [Blastococcus sp. CT_GayMR20]